METVRQEVSWASGVAGVKTVLRALGDSHHVLSDCSARLCDSQFSYLNLNESSPYPFKARPTSLLSVIDEEAEA